MAEAIKFCIKCGNKVSPGAKFCRSCGHKLYEDVAETPVKVESKNKDQKKAAATNNAAPAEKTEEVIPTKAQSERAGEISANGTPGEFEALSFTMEADGAAGENSAAGSSMGSAGTSNRTAGKGATTLNRAAGKMAGAAAGALQKTAIMTPLGTFWEGIKSIIGGAFSLFGNPKMLITTALLALVWIVLGMNRGSDSPVMKGLSWLTFAEGGFGRDGLLGTLGGICGKGAVGAMLLSVFNGGISKLFSGISALTKKGSGKVEIVPILLGYLIGVVTDFAFTGVATASAQTTMAGISGIVLSLQALGSKEGFLYSLAASFTAQKVDGVRTAAFGRIKSLIIGMITGFASITALTSLL